MSVMTPAEHMGLGKYPIVKDLGNRILECP